MKPLDLVRPSGQFTVFRVDDVDGDSEARYRWWAYLMTTRAMIGLAVAGLLYVSSDPGTYRPWMLGLAAAWSVVGNFAYFTVACHNDRLTRWIPPWEFLSVGLIGLMVPTAFPASMILMAIAVGIWTIAFGPRFGLALLVASAPFYGVVAAVGGADAAMETWMLFVIGGILGVVVNGLVSLQIHGVKERYTELVETIHAVVWERNGPDAPMSFVNPVVGTMLGISPAEWLNDGQRLGRVHPDDRLDVALGHSSERTTQREYRFIRADDSEVWLLETIIPAPSESHPDRVRGIVVDISSAKAHQETVEHLNVVMDEAPTPLWVLQVDESGLADSARLVASNRAASRDPLWGSETVGDTVTAWTSGPDGHETSVLLDALAGVIETGEARVEEQFGWTNDESRPRTVRLRVFQAGRRHYAVSVEDISAEVESADALRHAATHDALTGLGNRALLQERLNDALHGDDDPAATLLMMDLNQFKEVNDALGHLHGDRLLIELSRRLSSAVTDEMTVARLGGDEFAVIIPGAVAPRIAAELASTITETFSQPVMIDGISLQTTVSVGIASAPRDGTDSEALLQHADIAMYQAKVQGTGFTVFSPDDSVSRKRRLRLTGELPRAVAEDEFVVHFQPKFDLITGNPTDCEALVRWQHPELGLLGPGEFIELAEVSGHIRDIASLVLTSAVKELVTLQSEFGPIGLAVNLSVRNLYDPSLLDAIRRTCSDTGFDPTMLTVEVTESELMDDPGLAMSVLLRIREMGLGVSIDDFGTGYSSLAYLRNLPATELKVDRSFVNSLEHDDDIVVRTIIELGHNLGMRVIAEGVETTHQRDLLASLGCDGAQGFLFCHPLGIDDFRRHLALRKDPAAESGDLTTANRLGRPQLPFGNIAS